MAVNKGGFFVAIEGGDGLGKSTLVDKLKNKYSDAVFTFEPGGTGFGANVREFIMESKDISTEAEMYLFGASRAEIVRRVIKPCLSAGKMVVTDRYVYSSIVYQGIVGGLGVQNVMRVNELAIDGVLPDLVICLVGDRSFRTDNVNRFDNQTSEKARAINDAFKSLCNIFDNIVYIDVTNLSVNEVFNNAVKMIEDKIGRINGQ